MFVPIEPAFMLALQEDDGLWLDAYNKGVLLAGPTTVLFVVRIVENLWHQEKQAKNVQKVMDRGVKLYDKFVGFVDDLEAVGSRINDADLSYKEAFKKLTSGRENLVRQVEMLREISLKPKKRLKATLLAAAGMDEEDEILPLLVAEAESDEGGTN
jgi:DNA recombination protein RmuC